MSVPLTPILWEVFAIPMTTVVQRVELHQERVHPVLEFAVYSSKQFLKLAARVVQVKLLVSKKQWLSCIKLKRGHQSIKFWEFFWDFLGQTASAVLLKNSWSRRLWLLFFKWVLTESIHFRVSDCTTTINQNVTYIQNTGYPSSYTTTSKTCSYTVSGSVGKTFWWQFNFICTCFY